jgi:translation initiation factor IF-1
MLLRLQMAHTVNSALFASSKHWIDCLLIWRRRDEAGRLKEQKVKESDKADARTAWQRSYCHIFAPTLYKLRIMPITDTAGAEQSIELEGTIQTVLPGTMFRVVLDNQHQVLAHISGKMRRHFVRLTAGDRVRLEMSPYDLSKARITYRLR